MEFLSPLAEQNHIELRSSGKAAGHLVGIQRTQLEQIFVNAIRNAVDAILMSRAKTTLLNLLSSFIDPAERLITIEDAAELQLRQEHVVRLETRPPNIDGNREVNSRELVRNALRMRPDRIILGEERCQHFRVADTQILAPAERFDHLVRQLRQIMIKDPSMVEIAHQDLDGLPVGSLVRLQMPLVGWRNAEVRWARDGHAGCRLLVPLDTAELRAAVASEQHFTDSFPGLSQLFDTPSAEPAPAAGSRKRRIEIGRLPKPARMEPQWRHVAVICLGLYAAMAAWTLL